MLVLALDTSNRHASIALCSEEDVYGEYTWRIENNHSVELLPRISRLVAECHATLAAIDGIAVAIGPGSFNGVRVALATAKTLAFVLDKPLCGISTLDIFAAQQQALFPLCAVMDAGRSELYAACYSSSLETKEGGNTSYILTRTSEYGIYAPAEVVELLQEQKERARSDVKVQQEQLFLICGEMSESTRQVLAAEVQAQGVLLNNVQSTRHASVLAALAIKQWQEGYRDDPLLLEPLYLRRPSITTSTRKRALLGAAQPWSQGHTEREEGAVRN